MAQQALPIKTGWKTPIGTVRARSLPNYTVAWETDTGTTLLTVSGTILRPTGVLSQQYMARMFGESHQIG